VVRNVGGAAAGASQLAYSFDGGAESLADTPPLNPGAFTTVFIDCPGPNQITVGARADATNVVAEGNEFNNSQSAPVSCAVTQPDLVVNNVSVTGTGASGTISATVQNIGDGDAGASVTEIRQDNGPITDLNTPALAAGASTTVSVACGDGSDSASAVADINNNIAESNESNNSNSGSGTCFVGPH
jgi:subtilase family serine protease